MTSRERMTMLLNKKIPDRMGLFEHFWPETIRDCWVNEGYPEGEEPGDYFDFDLKLVERVHRQALNTFVQ